MFEGLTRGVVLRWRPLTEASERTNQTGKPARKSCWTTEGWVVNHGGCQPLEATRRVSRAARNGVLQGTYLGGKRAQGSFDEQAQSLELTAFDEPEIPLLGVGPHHRAWVGGVDTPADGAKEFKVGGQYLGPLDGVRRTISTVFA